MSTEAETTTLAYPRFPQLVALIVVAAIAAGIAVLCAAWGLNEQARYNGSPALVLALGTLQNAFLLVAVVAGVGAIVLAGVRALLADSSMVVRSARPSLPRNVPGREERADAE